MATTRRRLTDKQVDELADALEQFAQPAQSVTYQNYQMAHDPSRKLGIQSAHGFPKAGLTTAVSFGLAHEVWTDVNFPDRTELVQGWDGPSLEHTRLLLAVAEGSISTRTLPKPGVIYEGAVVSARLPELARRMPHATVLFPYLWGDAFTKVVLSGGIRVWFVQVVPLYDVEVKYIQQKGFAAFEEVLTEVGAFFDQLHREPYVVL